jgi:hypothetical protein
MNLQKNFDMGENWLIGSGGIHIGLLKIFKKIFHRPFSGRKSRLTLVAGPGWEIAEKQPYTLFWQNKV